MRATGIEPVTYGLKVCHSATLPHVKLHATRGLTMFSGEFRFVSESVNPAKKARQRRVNLRVPEGGVGYSVSCRFLSSSTLLRSMIISLSLAFGFCFVSPCSPSRSMSPPFVVESPLPSGTDCGEARCPQPCHRGPTAQYRHHPAYDKKYNAVTLGSYLNKHEEHAPHRNKRKRTAADDEAFPLLQLKSISDWFPEEPARNPRRSHGCGESQNK